jgi:thioredoxin-disulfide reductase
MRELIIVGGGAAGITAGIYAARKYVKTLLIADDFTGQVGVSAWIENYPGFKKISGLKLIKSFKEHLDLFDNIEVKSFEKVKKISKIKNGFRIITDENNYDSRAVLIAAGSAPKKLNIENEGKFLGKGLSYCATCDGISFKGKAVAVVGGGNAGAEAALELSRFCKKIYILELLGNLSADKILREEIKNNNKIKILTSVKIKSLAGENNLEKIVYNDLKLKKDKFLAVDGCFVEIGTNPGTGFVSDLVKLNKKKEIEVNPITLESSVKGIFAAGDVAGLPGKQVVIACGQGASALLSVYKYLTKN